MAKAVKKKRQKKTDKKQSERFIEVARTLTADDDKIERTFKTLAQSKRGNSQKSKP